MTCTVDEFTGTRESESCCDVGQQQWRQMAAHRAGLGAVGVVVAVLVGSVEYAVLWSLVEPPLQFVCAQFSWTVAFSR